MPDLATLELQLAIPKADSFPTYTPPRPDVPAKTVTAGIGREQAHNRPGQTGKSTSSRIGTATPPSAAAKMAYSPSRRSEDRHVRDRRDDRGNRRRSRSREVRGFRRPSPRRPSSRNRNPSDLTYTQRDRDSYRRRDRSYDRYDDRRDDRRSGRRDRSRDRKRSRDRSPVRDRRDDRDRYRDSRDSYDNRDRKRPRRSPSPRRDDRARDAGRDRRTPARTSERGSEVCQNVNPQRRTRSLTKQTPRPSTANVDTAADFHVPAIFL